ncbi:MAG: hypothetical protein AB8D78_11745 [Akkermansiaceae bacterium]
MTTLMIQKKFITLAAFSLFCSTSISNAAISVLPGSGTGSATFNSNYPQTVLSSFDASNASKIVFTVSTEFGFNDDPLTSITFGGDSFTPGVNGTNSIQNTTIYYLDATTAGGTFGTGDLVVNGTGRNDYGVSWMFLSGTADGVGPINSSTTQSVNLTTLVDGSFVVASHANNGNSGAAQSPLTALLNADVGSAGGGSGYATVVTAGSGNYSFTGSNSRPATVAAAFEAAIPAAVIPEPSVALLGSLSVLALLRRRRN